MRLTAFFVLACVGSVTACGSVQESSSDAVTLTVARFEVSEAEAARAAEYWTPERMAAAIPLDTPVISAEELAALQAARRSPLTDDDPPPIVRQGENERGTPQRPDIRRFPFRTVGKLFFVRGGKDYSCTAQFVGHVSVLMTAAHCIVGLDGAFASDFHFELQYNNGAYAASFNVACGVVWDQATPGGDNYNWEFDYGFLRTTTPGTEFMNLRIYQGASSWTAVGYPENYGDSEQMYSVGGTRGTCCNGGVLSMDGNPMGRGSSGGAWVQDLFTNNWVEGLNSFSVRGQENTEWGPVFTGEVVRQLDLAKSPRCGSDWPVPG